MPGRVSVDVKIRGLEKLIDIINKDVATKIFERSQKNIDEMNIIASGYLKRSGRVEKISFNEYKVTYDAPYALFVEYGTRPHMPPVEQIKEWAKLKFGLSDEEAEKVAWAIANKIKKEGTDPKPFLRNAIDDVLRDMRFKRFRIKYIRMR